MPLIRPPAVANHFYPGDVRELTRMLDSFLAAVSPHAPPPKAIIVPHAGYRYSGAVAATAYATLMPVRDQITRVILMGPSHRVPLRGLATSDANDFQTPLGLVPLDRLAIEQALRLPQVVCLDEAHAQEHSLEVQLPFLQRVLTAFKLVPFVVGDASPESVAEVLKQLWGGAETLIVISTDLSHYEDYRTAQRHDAATSAAIESLRPQNIGVGDACGRNALNGLLTLAKADGLNVSLLDRRNSGDTAGAHDQVVGYGAYALH